LNDAEELSKQGFHDDELPTILRNVDLERIARGEGCQVTGCAVGKGKGEVDEE